MALDSGRLSSAIFATLTGDAGNGFSAPMSAEQEGMVRAWADAIAEAVVAEVTAHAEVVVQSVTGVTPGTGASGPGTGTVR